MNSKQRRRQRRYWRYEVQASRDYLTYDEYYDMFIWCRKNFGITVSDGWRTKPGQHDWLNVWQFDSEQKASLFALRWQK